MYLPDIDEPFCVRLTNLMDLSVPFRHQHLCRVWLVHPDPSGSDACVARRAELDIVGAAVRVVAHNPRRRMISVGLVKPRLAVAADAQCVLSAFTGDAVVKGVAVRWRPTLVVG